MPMSKVQYGTGTWDAESYGNHRAVVELTTKAKAVWAHIPWRRRDRAPENKNIIVVDATTGRRITNVARVDVNREFGDLVFQPETVPGTYYVYYLPYSGAIRSYYPKTAYPEPEPTARKQWLNRYHLTPDALPQGRWKELPQAQVLEIQSIDELDSFFPMEVIATRAETDDLLAKHPDAAYLLFPEDRAYPIRMPDDLPLRWIEAGAGQPLHGKGARGEFYAFQIGVYAARESIAGLDVRFGDLKSTDGESVIPKSAFRCFNLGGVEWTGKEFSKTVSVEKGQVQALWCGVQIPEYAPPGKYKGKVTVIPHGLEKSPVTIKLTVSKRSIKAAGDDDPWRLSRLRWLDSKLALDDTIVFPFTPVEVEGKTIGILGRKVTLEKGGLPKSIQSYFAPEMTHLVEKGQEILAGPMSLIVESPDGERLPWKGRAARFVKQTDGTVAWKSKGQAGPLRMDLHAEMAFDGNVEYTVAVSAEWATLVGDIRIEIPIAASVAKYAMGLGLKGGYRPAEHRWKWDVKKNQDSAWIGDVNAGLQFTLKDDRYSRPLNTNFYQLKPLVLPASWHNEGKGGVHITEKDEDTLLVSCYSGPRTIRKGETLYFNFRLLLTPFKPINTRAQWTTRFYHGFEPPDEVAATGANTINVHHATDINPYINYPFLRTEEMKAYVDEAHKRGLKVKIYYTVRELANRAPELFALRSLGYEILSDGPGGGCSWLQEHLVSNYIGGWFVFERQDAAVINSGTSRWHNYYVEGLDWLARNVSIDGIYIDDLAFDRIVMQRVRKVLDRRREGALIDLHSANQFNERDGFASSANLYLEHFPYLNRLWFGEYFEYDRGPDYWLVEVSGIPFGLMGEMLQDGGNPWRGMIFGMTGRLPWAGDPRPMWKVWDDFGIEDSRMIGYWSPSCPVRTSRQDVLATVYVKQKKALVSIASWARRRVAVKLEINWDRLGIDPEKARITAPVIEDFQDAAAFAPADKIPVEPKKGRLLVIDEG
jgi:hypothetical protein